MDSIKSFSVVSGGIFYLAAMIETQLYLLRWSRRSLTSSVSAESSPRSVASDDSQISEWKPNIVPTIRGHRRLFSVHNSSFEIVLFVPSSLVSGLHSRSAHRVLTLCGPYNC